MGALATGATGLIVCVPYACSIDFINFAAFGISGTPTVQIICNRFISGTGFTAFNIGSTAALANFGTSGPIVSNGGSLAYGMSIAPIGSTLTQLFAGDVLIYQLGGSSSAVTGLAVNAVLRPISDIVKYYNTL